MSFKEMEMKDRWKGGIYRWKGGIYSTQPTFQHWRMSVLKYCQIFTKRDNFGCLQSPKKCLCLQKGRKKLTKSKMNQFRTKSGMQGIPQCLPFTQKHFSASSTFSESETIAAESCWKQPKEITYQQTVGVMSLIIFLPKVSLNDAFHPLPDPEKSVLNTRNNLLLELLIFGGSSDPQNFPRRGAWVSEPSYTAT